MDWGEVKVRLEKLHRETCLYCRTPLEKKSVRFSRGEDTGFGKNLDGWWVQYDLLSTEVCKACGWWCKWDVLSKQTSFEDDFIQTESCTEAVVALFDIAGPNVPLHALRLHLATHPNSAEHINPTALERLVGDVYRDFFDCEVVHVGSSGDQGIDLVAIISDEPVLLQVKRNRAGSLRGGPEIVRALLGASLLAGVNRAHLVTSATKFTKATIETADRARSLSYHNIHISLVSLGDLLKMLKVANECSAFIWQLAGEQ
jgi:hypothetical protein